MVLELGGHFRLRYDRTSAIYNLSIFIWIWIVSMALMCMYQYRGDPIATRYRDARSPSGQYVLSILRYADSEGTEYQSFQILCNGKIIFATKDSYRLDALYILWDDDDRVWVYSGDVGTFYYERSGESWWKHVFARDGAIRAPEYLRAVEPRWH